MTVCRFYLQGRCRYGDRCWYEHTDPPSHVPQRRDNYTWVSPSVSSSRGYSQPQFSRNSFSGNYREPSNRYNNDNDYNRSSTPTKTNYDQYRSSTVYSGFYESHSYPYEKSKSKQSAHFQSKPSNRFEVLSQDDAGRSNKENNLISSVKNEITEWEESHMWPFSCRSDFRDPGECMSGFVDISPEELRCIAYEAEKNGAFPFYTGIVSAALTEVKKKWDVLQNVTADVLHSIKSYRGAPDFCEENLKKLIPESTAGPFSGEQINNEMLTQVNTASASSNSFSFKTAHLNSPQSLGSSTSAFKSVLPSALDNKVESFFPASEASTPGFGASSTSGFGTSSTSGFGASSSSVFGSSITPSVSSVFGPSGKERHDASIKTDVGSEVKSCAYTPLENLTASERAQFSSATFTLGKIPSRPPPMDLCF